MNAGQAATIVKDTLESLLSSALVSAGLTDFQVYQDEAPRTAEEKALCVYVIEESYSQDTRTVSLMIQAQLYRERNVNAYHDVIMDCIVNNLSAKLVGMQNVESLGADVWPFSRNVSSSYLYYELTYISELDDCFVSEES